MAGLLYRSAHFLNSLGLFFVGESSVAFLHLLRTCKADLLTSEKNTQYMQNYEQKQNIMRNQNYSFCV